MVADTAGAGGAGRGLIAERQCWGTVQGGGCVQTGSAASFLPNGAGRIPGSGEVERKGEDCGDAGCGAGRGLREAPE